MKSIFSRLLVLEFISGTFGRIRAKIFRTRPVGERSGEKPPLQRFSLPLKKCVGRSLKILNIVQKFLAPLGKLFTPPGVLSWLRDCFATQIICLLLHLCWKSIIGSWNFCCTMLNVAGQLPSDKISSALLLYLRLEIITKGMEYDQKNGLLNA